VRLTGRFNFRQTFTGKLVLQVEEEVKAHWPRSRTAPTRRRWRDAKVMDLTKHELRALVDLRTRPQFVPQSYGLPEEPLAGAVEEFPGATAPAGAEPAVRGDGRISRH
jgi:hypothetical protein